MNRKTIITLSLLLLLAGGTSQAQNLPPRIPLDIVEPREKLRSEKYPKGTFILNKRDFIECRGELFRGAPPPGRYTNIRWDGKIYTNPGEFNNDIIKKHLAKVPLKKADLLTAHQKLRAAIKADPVFFPFLYNIGRTAYLLRLPHKSIRYMRKAGSLLPAYWRVDYNLGFAYARAGQHLPAVTSFRTAARKNTFIFDAYIALGNLYLDRNSFKQADYYFKVVLRFRENHANAKLGLARILMQQRKYQQARILMKSIPIENLDGSLRTDYDRSLHYYLGYLAAELRDYEDAVKEYERLLEHPEDPFFLNISYEEIERRKNIVQRLADTRRKKLK